MNAAGVAALVVVASLAVLIFGAGIVRMAPRTDPPVRPWPGKLLLGAGVAGVVLGLGMTGLALLGELQGAAGVFSDSPFAGGR